jgi:hypothetical protein
MPRTNSKKKQKTEATEEEKRAVEAQAEEDFEETTEATEEEKIAVEAQAEEDFEKTTDSISEILVVRDSIWTVVEFTLFNNLVRMYSGPNPPPMTRLFIFLVESGMTGPTSCRMLVVLIVLVKLTTIVWGHMTNTQKELFDNNPRMLLSHIWRIILIGGDPYGTNIKAFFNGNYTEDLRGNPYLVKEVLTAPPVSGGAAEASENQESMFDKFRRKPISVIAILRRNSTVLHYFTILCIDGVLYIYSSYGSDYVHAFPTLTELDEETFLQLIRTGDPTKELDGLKEFFEEHFTVDGKMKLDFIVEGKSKKFNLDTELTGYTYGYTVCHFPTADSELIIQAVQALEAGSIIENDLSGLKTKLLVDPKFKMVVLEAFQNGEQAAAAMKVGTRLNLDFDIPGSLVPVPPAAGGSVSKKRTQKRRFRTKRKRRNRKMNPSRIHLRKSHKQKNYKN